MRGDFRSAFNKEATRIYASGERLTYINTTVNDIYGTSRPIHSPEDFELYRGAFSFNIVDAITGSSIPRRYAN